MQGNCAQCSIALSVLLTMAAVVLYFLQGTGSLRPAFIFVFLVLLIPLLVIVFFLNHKQGIKDARRVPETAPLDEPCSDDNDKEATVVKLKDEEHLQSDAIIR